jgi:hypothetical protein
MVSLLDGAAVICKCGLTFHCTDRSFLDIHVRDKWTVFRCLRALNNVLKCRQHLHVCLCI